MQELRIFLLMYIVSIAFLYGLISKTGSTPPLLPGDIYIHQGAKKIYIPLGSSVIMAIVLFVLFNIIF